MTQLGSRCVRGHRRAGGHASSTVRGSEVEEEEEMARARTTPGGPVSTHKDGLARTNPD